MTALAPSGVGLPAPDCLVHSSSGARHRLSELAATRGWLLLVPSVFGCEEALAQLISLTDQLTVISGDNANALQRAALAASAPVYCDPSLLFARLYGISAAANGCHFGLFQLQSGWIRSSLITEHANFAYWQALLTQASQP